MEAIKCDRCENLEEGIGYLIVNSKYTPKAIRVCIDCWKIYVKWLYIGNLS